MTLMCPWIWPTVGSSVTFKDKSDSHVLCDHELITNFATWDSTSCSQAKTMLYLMHRTARELTQKWETQLIKEFCSDSQYITPFYPPNVLDRFHIQCVIIIKTNTFGLHSIILPANGLYVFKPCADNVHSTFILRINI
jgi:hypothetical protein